MLLNFVLAWWRYLCKYFHAWDLIMYNGLDVTRFLGVLNAEYERRRLWCHSIPEGKCLYQLAQHTYFTWFCRLSLNLIPLFNIMCYFLTHSIPESRAISVHQLSKKFTQRIPFKLHGLPVSTAFHPSRSVFFISTKMTVRVYDLLKHELIKKLETGLRNVSSISIHPGGMLPVSCSSLVEVLPLIL